MKLGDMLASSRSALVLLPWAVLVGIVLRTDPYGLSEEGAKALLVAWSIGDAVASAAFTLGAPDIRVILFLPLGFLWPGEVLAAKLLTLLAMGAAAIALYRWRRRGDQDEAALLATGLLLIAPLTVEGINALSAAPFLLALCGAATWINEKVVAEKGTIGGWFFFQLLACAAAVSFHPAGLAYPAMLIYTWSQAPRDQRPREYFLIGIPVVVAVALAMRMGWAGIGWLQNPLPAAAAIFNSNGAELALPGADWVAGAALIAVAVAVAVHERRRLFADLTGGSLLLALPFGALAADRIWALLLFALLLYGGLPWLLRACAPLAGRGLMIQRGWLWLILLLVCTAFMRTNRGDFEAARNLRFSAEDQLIRDFADGISTLRATEAPAAAAGSTAPAAGAAPPAAPLGAALAAAPILVASSWPARTSIACKCDGLPLPPAASDPQSQLAMMRGVSYVILGDSVDNRPLAFNFAQMGAQIEVLAREPGGVILHLKPPRAVL